MPLKITRREGSPFWWITGTIGGKRVRESTGISDTGTAYKRLAEERRSIREAQLLREAVHGSPVERKLFSTVAASYLEHAGPHAIETRLQVLRLMTFFGPGIAADDVDQAALDRACTALLRPNPRPATRLRHIISPARAVLTHGAKRRMCAVPVFDVGKASPSRTEWLAPEQVDALIGAAAPHLRPLFIFLAGTGARMSEALSLDWRDVDLKHARATLRDTKNGTDQILDLCPRVVAGLLYDPRAEATALRRDKAALQRLQSRATLVAALRQSEASVHRIRAGHVFLTRAGRPYGQPKVQRGGQIKTGWKAAKSRAGIVAEVSPHSLRHTWATWHYAQHKDVLLLKKDGGWEDVAMVERYAHLAPAGLVPEIVAWRAAGTILTHDTQHTSKRQTISAA